MQRIRLLLISVLALFLTLLLTACATVHPVNNTEPEHIGLLLSPASLGKSISLQQHMTVTGGGKTHELDTVLEIDPQQLNLVGLLFGRRFMTIHYDGKTLTTWKDPHVPAQINSQSILEDIELTLWPINILHQSLPFDWHIQQYHHYRMLYQNHMLIEKIDYLKNNTVIIHNYRYQYRIKIQSVIN
ncbi:MAG TPA: DUF3261 domain-containing protein [Gammaproteobacteria bacterium]|nr:DUF3261 domain-containing protein [Gammaproteobacteria bacterium]